MQGAAANRTKSNQPHILEVGVYGSNPNLFQNQKIDIQSTRLCLIFAQSLRRTRMTSATATSSSTESFVELKTRTRSFSQNCPRFLAFSSSTANPQSEAPTPSDLTLTVAS